MTVKIKVEREDNANFTAKIGKKTLKDCSNRPNKSCYNIWLFRDKFIENQQEK